jgi:hypothetical protein
MKKEFVNDQLQMTKSPRNDQFPMNMEHMNKCWRKGLGNCEFRISNFKWENRTVDDGNRRWMSLDDGEKNFSGRLSERARRAPRSVVVGRKNYWCVIGGQLSLMLTVSCRELMGVTVR